MDTKRMMQHKRATGGFTMVEMIIAIAILVILMGVAFVNVLAYQRSMKQLELDKTAQEIFVAAQNHLTVAKSQGILEDVDKNSTALVGEKDDGESVYRYWYVSSGDARLKSANTSLLYEMLPFASIDDTVRLGGSYVIAYDPNTATVVSVFYCDQSSLSTYQFSPSDYSTLFPALEGTSDDVVAARRDGINGAVVGWYGGEGLIDRTKKELVAPEIKLTNAERLEVTVSFSTSAMQQNREVEDAVMRLVLRGDTSKHSKIIATVPLLSMASVGGEYRKTYVLDDITTSGQYFKELWCGASLSLAANAGESGPLIPGENISVYAQVYSTSVLSSIAKSATKHTNSLFARMISEKVDTETERYAAINNIRHLENLDAAISGYDLEALGEDGATKARQISDLMWISNSSSKKIRAFANRIAGSVDGAKNVKVRYLDGTSTKAGTFAPVTPRSTSATNVLRQYALTYEADKGSKKISNVKVELEAAINAPAGVFATVASGSSISGLELVDCSISTKGGSAGTLLGVAMGTLDLTNILVHDTKGTVKSTVSSTEAAGGLVGLLQPASGTTVTIDGCGAATLVEAKGTGTVAGGLVGYADGNVSIANSYAGGRTKDGAYDAENANVKAGSIASGGVVAPTQGVAGGLVGYTRGANITYCYATASVSGEGAMGGLVGYADKTTIGNCYATGLIIGNKTHAGAFAGNMDDATYNASAKNESANNYYFEMVNSSVYPISNRKPVVDANGNPIPTQEPVELDGLKPVDKNTKTFNDFCTGDAEGTDAAGEPVLRKNNEKAAPYDESLGKLYARADENDATGQTYNSIYNLRTIKLLNSKAEGPWVSSHYGDWPSPETLFVNTK